MARSSSGPISKVVIDSSPLMNLLALHYARTSEGARPSPDRIITGDAAKDYLYGRRDNQDKFLRLFDSIPLFITSSHVVGEIQGLSQALKLDGQSRKIFWSNSIEYLKNHGFLETTLTLLHLDEREEDRAWIGILGPTDTGLIRLAQQQGCPLLTDDERTLYKRALELGVDCHLVKNFL